MGYADHDVGIRGRFSLGAVLKKAVGVVDGWRYGLSKRGEAVGWLLGGGRSRLAVAEIKQCRRGTVGVFHLAAKDTIKGVKIVRKRPATALRMRLPSNRRIDCCNPSRAAWLAGILKCGFRVEDRWTEELVNLTF